MRICNHRTTQKNSRSEFLMIGQKKTAGEEKRKGKEDVDLRPDLLCKIRHFKWRDNNNCF